MVNAIPDDVGEGELREKFSKFGEIGDVFAPRYRDSGRGRGFAFVRYVKRDDLEYCLDEFEKNPINIHGRALRVEEAKQRPRPG